MNTITITENEYMSLFKENRFVKVDERIYANTLLSPSSKLWLSFVLNKRDHFIKEKIIDQDGWFYLLQIYIERGTALSSRTQYNVIQQLQDLSILEIKQKDKDPRNFYRISAIGLYNFLKETEDFSFNLEAPEKSADTPKPTTPSENFSGTLSADFSDKEEQIKKLDQISLNTPSVCSTNHVNVVCVNGLHPIKKTIKIRTTPLNIVPEDPYKNNHEGKTPIFVKKKKPKHLKETDEMLEILCYWESKEFKRSIPGEHTESYARLLLYIDSLLKGTLFEGFKDKGIIRKYSVREVKISIDNFTLAAFNNDYEPMSLSVKEYLQTLSLSDFLYNPRENDEHRKSKFLLYLGKPKLVADNPKFLVKDELPNITNRLEDWYKHTFHNSNGSFKRNDLIFASKALKKFYEDNKSKLYLEDYMSQYNLREPIAFLAKQLTRVFEKMLRENDGLYTIITTEWLKSAKTMEDRLPSFLRSEHMMK